jgi:hypothetical protein
VEGQTRRQQFDETRHLREFSQHGHRVSRSGRWPRSSKKPSLIALVASQRAVSTQSTIETTLLDKRSLLASLRIN